MRLFLSFMISLIPINRVKVFVYRLVLGYNIDYQTHIGFCNIIKLKKVKLRRSKIGYFNIITGNQLIMDEAIIVKFNKIKKINKVSMGSKSIINKYNLIMGNETHNLSLGPKTAVLVNMLIDVSEHIKIGTNVCFAGTDTQIWTHSYDVKRNLTTKPIIIGDEIYIGSRCLINPGIEICNNVTIGGGTIVSKNITESGLYVSSTLIKKK